MSDERRFGWFGAVTFFFVGCVLTFLGVRYWPRTETSPAPLTQQSSKNRWTFQTDFKLPKSITVSAPDKTDILVFDVHKPKLILEPYPVSIKNLSDRAYSVSYVIYAYDTQNRRVDETSDSVIVGAKETILRQLEFSHPLSVDRRTFASFRLIADIDH